MRTSLVRRLGVLFVALVMTAIAVIVQPQKALAVTEIKDDTDLAHVQAYQFTMTQENMSVISQSGDVDMVLFLLKPVVRRARSLLSRSIRPSEPISRLVSRLS